MKKDGGSESTIIIGPSKSALVYALHSLKYVLGLARFRVFVLNISKGLNSFIKIIHSKYQDTLKLELNLHCASKLRRKYSLFNAVLKMGLWYPSISMLDVFRYVSNFCKQLSPHHLRIFWPNSIGNAALLNLTNEEPILLQIKRIKWWWG